MSAFSNLGTPVKGSLPDGPVEVYPSKPEDLYTLDDQRQPVPADLLTWARWFETADRHIARTELGNVVVSTVFLGIDHGFGMSEKPLLFETMVFGGLFDGMCERCSTHEQALRQHDNCVQGIKSAIEEGFKP